jgi:hypothetical protein
MDTNNHTETKPSIPSGLALIEKAQELRWTLQLAAAVLFADLVFVWHSGQGIIQWSVRTDQLLANSGFVLVSVLVFGLLMSIVIPLVAEIFRWIGWELLINIPWPSWMKTDIDYRRPLNGVSSHELRDHAHQKNDHRLWEIADAHEQRQKANLVSNLAAGQLAFSILLLALLDFKPGLIGLTGVTMLKEVTLAFGQLGELALAGGAILAAMAIKKTWFEMAPPTWISYKPLYDEIEEKRRRYL